MSPPLTKLTITTAPKPPQPLCTLVFLIILCILAFYTLHHPTPTPTNPLRYRSLFLSLSSNSTISSYLRSLTLHPHLAGTPLSLATANYVYSHFKETLNLDAHTLDYTALLSYPVRSSLSAHFSNGSSVTFSLTENSMGPGVVPPYHAYSPSGTAHGKVVYVNHGREEDYHALGALGVNVSGCVVVARKGGGLSRGGVVRIAASRGALAVLIYAEGDSIRGGVERGTVMRGVGDPLTPGWAGVEGGERLGLEDSQVLNRFPKIPSLPLSFENADVILGSLGGPVVPASWMAGSGRSRVLRVGPGPTAVNFSYQVAACFV